MRRNLIASSLLALLASALLSAQATYLTKTPGRWKPWSFTAYPDDIRALGARAADLREIEAQLQQLNAIIRKTEGFSAPIGFSIGTGGLLDLAPAPNTRAFGTPLTTRPLPYQLAFGAFGITEDHSGAVVKPDDSGETPHIYFGVNQVTHPLFMELSSRVPEFDNIETGVARLAPPQPDAFGMPRYGDIFILKKSPEPIWAPVAFGETLDFVAQGIEQRLIGERDVVARVQKGYDDIKDPRKQEERMAQYRKLAPLTKDPTYLDQMTQAEAKMLKQADTLLPQIEAAKAVVAKSEQELAAAKTMSAGLSVADKAAPACYASADKVSLSRFRRMPSPGCDALVRPNWKVFNPALPRTAPQLLTIAWSCTRVQPRPDWAHGCTANRKLLESIDKAALLAWLK